jgi:hypothetical protein
VPVRRNSRGQGAAGSRLVTAVAAALAVAAGAGGCGSDDFDDLPPPRSPAATAPTSAPALQLTAEEQQAVDEIRTLFDDFMQAYVDLATSGETPDQEAMLPVLVRLEHPFRDEVNAELVGNYLAERRLAGTSNWQFVSVEEVDLEPEASGRHNPSVRLRYCIDATDWTTVDIDGGGPAADSEPVFAPAIHLGTLRAVHFDRGGPDDPRWYLVEWVGREVEQGC